MPANVADFWWDGSSSDKPLVLLVHGGLWRPRYDRTHTQPMAAALRQAGWSVPSIEYRRTPGKPDDDTHDIRLAMRNVPSDVEALFDHHVVGTVLVGHSAGGQLALWVASRCPPGRASGNARPGADYRPPSGARMQSR
ncbi:alpha/beta fold hydrolase [Amycolatopsis antarctica]|uniref:alpha/beta hydrolase n=1 Tax=Amycolatopsis antarctica TaxID=1854586 RepID=UPI0013FE2461